jgi:hypothetical protein
MDKEDVRNILLSLAKGAETYGALAGGTVGTATSAAAGLVVAVASLLKQRTPEEAKQLIYDLAANPADRVDLSGLDDHVAAIIANRREREEP